VSVIRLVDQRYIVRRCHWGTLMVVIMFSVVTARR